VYQASSRGYVASILKSSMSAPRTRVNRRRRRDAGTESATIFTYVRLPSMNQRVYAFALGTMVSPFATFVFRCALL